MRGEGDRVPFVIFQEGEDCTGCEVRGICFKPELAVVVWVSEDWSGGEMGLQTCERVSFHAAPSEGLVFLREVCEGFCQSGIVFDKTSVEVGEAKETADAADRRGHGPVRDSFYLAVVHADVISVDEHP